MDKIRYLEEVLTPPKHAEGWVAAGAELKGFAADSPLVRFGGVAERPLPTSRWPTDMMATLEAIRTGEDPLAGFDVHATDRDRQWCG